MTSAAIYARVSSARQKKDQTIGSQTAALREHAAQARLDVPEEWVFEDEGHSGATLVRPALEALRDLAAQGCVDVVLVYSPDRLARKFAYQALLLEEFARAGVRVEFVKGPARRQPRGPAAGPVPGHVRRVRESPADGALPARQGLPRPQPGRSTSWPAPRSATGTSARPPDAGPPTRSSTMRRRWSPSCSAATPTTAPPSPTWPAGSPAKRPDPDRQAPLGPQGGLGHAAQPRLRRHRRVRQDPGPPRIAGAEPPSPACRAARCRGPVQDRRPAPRGVDRDPRPRDRDGRRPSTAPPSGWQTTSGSPPATPRSRPCSRAWPPARPADTATTAPPPGPRTRRSTTTGASAPMTTATKAAGSAATSRSAPTTSTRSSGTTSPACSPTRR